MKKLLILGAGQYGMVAREIAESMKCFEKNDFVDDVYQFAVGKICEINKLIHEYDSAVVAIGNSDLRLNLTVLLTFLHIALSLMALAEKRGLFSTI